MPADFQETPPSPSSQPLAPPPILMPTIPKIIYASRTHSQLTQVVKELKRSAYKYASLPVMLVVLTLIKTKDKHFRISKSDVHSSHCKQCEGQITGLYHKQNPLITSVTINDMCRALVSARKCQYHNSVSQYKSNSEFSDTVCDIEGNII